MPKVPRCFVLDLTHKLAEGGVEDRAGQLGFRKSLRVQILQADAVVLLRQVGRQLVEEVVPLVRHLAMHPSHTALRFLPATATRLLPGEILLNPPEPPLGRPREPRGRDALAIGEDEQVLETEVYPDRVDRSRRFYVRNLELGTQGNVPVSASVSLEGRALGRSFDSSGETDTNPTYLRDVYPAGLDSDALWDSESEVSALLEAQPGEAATLLEERIECP